MQTVNAGSAITQIKYTTANATSATPSNLPTGISSAWSSNVYTISGTPTSVGTYNYSVATTNSNGCTNVSATGKITVNPTPITYTYCTPPTLVLTGVGFANSTTYTRNGITLSAPVTVTTCQKETYAGGSSGAYKADCRTNPSYAGDLFSWCMVVQHAVQLCPTPWRVPTHNDFCKYAGFADECTSETSSIYDGIDGWLLGGYSSNGGKLYFDGLYGYYWSSTEYSAELSTNANVYGDRFLPIYHFEKYYGFSLRCVR
jgi:uncharacterized protein (TIGR02145 family)